MVQIGCEREESLGREPIGDVLDVIDESPVLLNHEHAVSARRRWSSEIAVRSASVGLEFDHHARHGAALVRGKGMVIVSEHEAAAA
jgi:hypothetical protein